MAHDSFKSGNFPFELFDFSPAGGHILIVSALFGIEFADKPFDFHAGLVVLLDERVVLEIYLLTFILVEVGVELIELIGEEELVVGDGEGVSAGLGVVDGGRVAGIADDKPDYKSDKDNQHSESAKDKHLEFFLIHNRELNTPAKIIKKEKPMKRVSESSVRMTFVLLSERLTIS